MAVLCHCRCVIDSVSRLDINPKPKRLQRWNPRGNQVKCGISDASQDSHARNK
jgi:hypothetical protein